MLFIGSLVIAMVISGCSEKSDVEVDESTTSGDIQDSNSNNGDTNSTMSGDSSENEYNTENTNSLYSVYFGFDKFIVEGNKNIDTIKNNAKLIINSGSNVRVEGNTDEWGSDEYNYALALKRASSVKDALIGNNVPSNKIELVSYGESKPKCTDKTKQCWKENRRVDFVLTPTTK
ncbi:OmpA family protein [Helicobacter sp. MIT 14-3879]|uniref:OmpA family protein n=1 Tax=Helicobacter sp. MIT 14-3879 TaxID=2040649 RepID=UPI0021614125|nr:OmpA family protein [Helicobacter sp. MIT 14-3879]